MARVFGIGLWAYIEPHRLTRVRRWSNSRGGEIRLIVYSSIPTRTPTEKNTIMPVHIDYQPNDMCVLQISGVLNQDEFAATQADLARKIDAGAKPRLLVVGENFAGWERGPDWNDLDFLISHSGEIAKIAVVAEPQWEVQALAFAGAGLRPAPVKFFPPSELAQARTWLEE